MAPVEFHFDGNVSIHFDHYRAGDARNIDEQFVDGLVSADSGHRASDCSGKCRAVKNGNAAALELSNEPDEINADAPEDGNGDVTGSEGAETSSDAETAGSETTSTSQAGSSPEDGISGPFVCPVGCNGGKSFASKKALKEHAKSEHR